MIERKNSMVKGTIIKGTLNWVTMLVAGLAVILIPYYSQATELYTYTYTGNHYELFSFYNRALIGYEYGTDDNVTAVFTFEQSLTPSLSFGLVTPFSFSVSDGIYTITNDNVLRSSLDNVPRSSLAVATDTEGNISEWDFATQALLWQDGWWHALSIGSGLNDMAIDQVAAVPDDLPEEMYEEIVMRVESGSDYYGGHNLYLQLAAVNDTGTWIVSQVPVPEPSTMLLLGTGLVGLIGFKRKLRKK